MEITTRDLETFKALDRYRYLRSNFVHGLVGGSKQNVCRRLGHLAREGYLHCPEQQRQSYNARYAPRVYELTAKSKALLAKPKSWVGTHQFWHQLMVSDILASFEIAAKAAGVTYRTQADILGDKPLILPCDIVWDGKGDVKKAIEPDGLFALNDFYFVIEADRGTETLAASVAGRNHYRQKLLGYIDIIWNRTYKTQWGIPNLFILNITTKPERIENIKQMFVDIRLSQKQANPRSQALAFKAIQILGSHDQTVHPLAHVLDGTFDRVGFPPLQIQELLNGGQHTTTTTSGTHRPEVQD